VEVEEGMKLLLVDQADQAEVVVLLLFNLVTQVDQEILLQ
jgi:hypothetical protein